MAIGLEAKFLELATQIVEENGYDLYDLDYIPGNQTLRVFIQNRETKTADLNDCVTIDRAFSEPVDTLEWMPSELILEVSSPGVYRKLKTRPHFDSAIGETIAVVIRGKIDEAKNQVKPGLLKQKKFRGELLESKEDEIIIDVDDEQIIIDKELIKKANVDPDFSDLTQE
jgi:ribosome maturation factor RimP